MRVQTLAAAALLLATTVSSGSWAQSAADHDAHHPATPATPSAPPEGQRGMGAAQGMMGGGMMNMMGGQMPMMDMMQMMRQSHGGMGGMGMMDRVEGRIAFLRAELKITDAQADPWNAFADALRANARNLREVRASMMAQKDGASQPLVDRLALQEKWLSARLEGTRAMKAALASLVGTFSDEQKKTADELLAPHMGMMPMMSAMHSGRMDPGQTQGMTMPGR